MFKGCKVIIFFEFKWGGGTVLYCRLTAIGMHVDCGFESQPARGFEPTTHMHSF